MKLLHVITGLPKAAGTSVFCGEVCNGLARAGHDVTLAVCDSGEATERYLLDARVKLVSITSLFEAGGYGEFEVVHVHAIWTPILHNVSAWAKRNNMPVVWSPIKTHQLVPRHTRDPKAIK